MERSDCIADETEFQEWLVSVLEAECERLREEAARRKSQQRTSFEVAKKNTTKETRHYEDER
jgi:hypothetical protein